MAEPHGLTNRGPRIPKLESGEKNNGVGATAQRSNVVRGAVALSLSLLLIQACASGDVAAVANFVSEQNANPFSKDESGRTPLGVACEAGHVQVAKYLIETEEVSPGFRGTDGATPLHSAARGGHLTVARYLVDEQGVNPSCTDKNGLRPIDYAKNSNVREFLLHYNSRGAQADWLGPGTNTSHHHTARSSTETEHSVVVVCFIDDDVDE